MSRNRNPICPRCSVRDKIPNSGYCRECGNAYRRERYQAIKAESPTEEEPLEVSSDPEPYNDETSEAWREYLEQKYGPPPEGFGVTDPGT